LEKIDKTDGCSNLLTCSTPLENDTIYSGGAIMAHQEMTLQDIIADIHALQEDLEVYERKYGVLSETFYESYMNGEEADDDSWVLDWSDWAGAYKILLRRQEQYRRTIQALRVHTPAIVDLIERTTQREPIPVAS
jgi:hypothetical protein